MNGDLYKRLSDPTDPLSIWAYMWFRRGKKKVCSNCKTEIGECDYCWKQFKPNQQIICMQSHFSNYERHHFCSEACRENWIKHYAIKESLEAKQSKVRITKK